MRRALPLALLVVTAVSAVRAQSSLGGTVRQKHGESLHPLADVYVQAKSGSPAEVIAQAQTDVRGRYRPRCRACRSNRKQGSLGPGGLFLAQPGI